MSKQPRPLREFWQGYRLARYDIRERGLADAERHCNYGNGGTVNFWKGYRKAVRDERKRRDERIKVLISHVEKTI